MKGDRRHRYFRWKEDICGTIEDRWEDLIPLKIKGPSWHNSVSSALSSNDRIFSSGVAIKGVPGWWALHHWDPPIPRRQAINNSNNTTGALKQKRNYQQTIKNEDILIQTSDSDSETDRKYKDVLNITENQSSENDELNNSNNYQFGDLIVDGDDDEELNENEPEIHTTQHTDRTPMVVAPSADLKKQLLERLLMMDSSLLDEAIKKAKAKKLVEFPVTSESSDFGKKKKKKDTQIISADKNFNYSGSDSHNFNIENSDLKVKITNANLNLKAQQTPALLIPPECQAILNSLHPFLTRLLTACPVIRASPYENDLLKKCNRVNYHEVKVAARLRRKLLLRRQRRRVNLALFDLDNFMYLYLKSAETPLRYGIIDERSNDGSELSGTIDGIKDVGNSSTIAPPQSSINLDFDFDSETIPYIADPSRSLYVKLTGMAALYGTCPYPVVSPFSGKLLPEFVDTDENCEVPKLLLLNQLRSLRTENFITNVESEETTETTEITDRIEFGIDLTSNIRPCSISQNIINNSSPLIVKYTNLRKEFVPQLNDILSGSFWPGIDVSEALDYPDYAIVALVGLSVIGCAIINPDGYLSYLHVRSDFQGHGIATRLLGLLLPQLSPRKDLTLHVSVSNAPAMVLYQKIGFKPEEFIVNFYDKYLNGSDENSSIGDKNAFLMRLRR